MQLIQTAVNPINGLPQICPKEKKDMAMFMHCTGGSVAVTVPAFFDNFLPVFNAHGIECFFDTSLVLSEALSAKAQEE